MERNMDERDPTLISILTALGLASLGGVVQFLREKVRKRQDFSCKKAITAMLIAWLAGLIMYFICLGLGFGGWFAAGMAGIAGNGGGVMLDLYHEIVLEFTRRRIQRK